MHYLSLCDPVKTVGLTFPISVKDKVINSVFSSFVTDNNSSDNPKIIYSINEDNKKYYLLRNNRLTHQNRDCHKIIYALEWQIINDFLKACKQKLKFHAASLAFQNEGCLFIGNSGTGKTSLSIMLMKHQWQLLSDEFGILDPKSLKIFPFPRNIIIKPHHPIDQNRRNKYVNTIYRTDKKRVEIFYFPPSEFGAVRLDPVRLKRIFFLNNVDTENFYIEKLKQYQALPLLLEHINNPNLIKKPFLEFISTIFANINCYNLYLPNPFYLSGEQQKHLLKQIRATNN